MNSVEVTLYLADKRINGMMGAVDLRPNYKQFITAQKVTFSTETQINDAYFLDLIEKSKEDEDHWIPALIYHNKFYHDPDVKVLSDGKKEMFIPQVGE